MKKICKKIFKIEKNQRQNPKKSKCCLSSVCTFCLNWSISDEWWSRTKNQRFFLDQTVEECGRWIFFGISFFWAWNLNHLSHPLMPFDAENDFSEKKKIARFLFEKSQKTVSRVKKNQGVKLWSKAEKMHNRIVDLKFRFVYVSLFSEAFHQKFLLSSKKAKSVTLQLAIS